MGFDEGVPSIKPREQDDELALARLGAVVVLRWQSLPAELREELLIAAEKVEGVRMVSSTGARIRQLVVSHGQRT